MLTASNIHRSFHQGSREIEVLKGLDLNVAAGETLAVLGKSGSGKSTLLGILAGLLRPSNDDASIVVDGVELTKQGPEQLSAWRAQSVGIVFQQFHLIDHLSALENIALPLIISGTSGEGRAKELLDLVGLADRADHYPGMLSGGERQRVALARALACHPKFVLADEPTGSLDVDTGRTITDELFRIIGEVGSSLILITHDQDLAKRCSRQVELKVGSLHAL